MSVFTNAVKAFAGYVMLAVFFENIILTRALGTSTSLFIVRKKIKIPVFCTVLTAVTICCTIIIHFSERFISQFDGVRYLRPVFYVIVIGVVYIAAILIISRLPAHIREDIIPLVHMSAFNCAVFGSLLLSRSYEFFAAIGFSVGAGVGFGLATFFVSEGYERLDGETIPAPFRGFPAMFIYLGIISMAFYGVIGRELTF